MADARPFHWEYVPERVTREVFRIEGGVPLHGNVQISGSSVRPFRSALSM